MNKLSVVIITFNEEKNIEGCLRSVMDIASEIIVVDSFSTDKTEAICKQYNVRFVKNPFKGHIEQKNFALALTENNHVLSLDADEQLSLELAASIKNVLAAWKYDAYAFTRLNNFCGQWIKHSGWYPDKKIRLFDKRKAHWGGTNPHDTIVLADDATCGELKGNLLHYSFYNIAQHIDQINKFSTIKAEGAFQRGMKSNLIRLLVFPVIKFFIIYFFKAGFLDGFYGLVIAVNSAFSDYLKYLKLRQLYRQRKHE